MQSKILCMASKEETIHFDWNIGINSERNGAENGGEKINDKIPNNHLIIIIEMI